jgi:type IV pilus assembly protein PilW
MKSINTSQKGFTLMELMVAMAIASIVMAGIYTFYRSQLRSHVTQQALVDMQQDARVAMYMMTREIRMAGCDPQFNTGAAIRIANAAEIAFDSDIFGPSGVLTDPAEPADGAIVASERFYYGLSNGNLVRGGWDENDPSATLNLNPVALNIDALNFVYLDNAGSPTATLAAIRSVQITLVARSGDQLAVLMRRQTDSRTYLNQQGDEILIAQNDNFRRIQLTATVKVRNLGL